MSIYKLAEGDTRRWAAWYDTYTRTDPKYGKEIGENEDMCLLTEVRDNYYSYEGFNMIAGCNNAQKWWRSKNTNGGNYVGPKGLEVCKCGWKE